MSSVHKLKTNQGPQLTAIDGGAFRRETSGWRAGKPVEDPEKMKRWGFVTAKPSEYLIHMRRGRIRRRTSGQGASCWKWPWDSVAVIPTTINRLQFTADQVTLEKVGVQITGLAVFRVVEPELTFRMLNFSFSERASEKLVDILGEMFVGATRRLVATLSVEEAMTKRKEAIGQALMAELAPVVAGAGKTEDTTARGWGVVIDTVEIQDVKILSESVFRNMQAKFRAELEMRARRAELASAKDIATQEASSAREIEEAKIAAETATREMRAQAESQTSEIELRERAKREALEAREAEVRIAREQARKVAELRAAAELAGEEARQEEAARLEAIERDKRLAASELEATESRHRAALRAAELEAARKQATQQTSIEHDERESVAAAQLRHRELELQRLEGELKNSIIRARREVENLISDDRIRMAVAERLPAIANAFSQTFGEVKLTTIGGAEATDPTMMIARSIGQVMELARGFGLDLPRAEAPKPAPE